MSRASSTVAAWHPGDVQVTDRLRWTTTTPGHELEPSAIPEWSDVWRRPR